MKNNNFLSTLKSNMLYAYVSQAVSTLIGVSFTLLIPKVLGVEGYGYWQLIVFYATYMGIFYIGINDGLYLRNGGKELEEINKPIIKKIVKCFGGIHSFLSVVIIFLTCIFVSDKNRAFVLIVTACYLPFFNAKGLLGQVIQASNNTKVTSVAQLIDRIVMFAAVVIGFILKIGDFRYYVIFYATAGILATFYCCFKARSIICCKERTKNKILDEVIEDIKAGLPLMISSFSALMITGVSRQIIDMKWEISAFSKISLALTMMNLVLVFLNQSSLVLFPAIRKLDRFLQVELYTSINRLVNIVTPFVLVLYVPIAKLINLWLPEYHESILFLGILLPICIWDGKMNLVNNTYYKVLRMERQLLVINIVTLIINTLFSVTGAYLLGSINAIAYGLLISIMFRSLVSEIILQKRICEKKRSLIFCPIFASVFYIFLNNALPAWYAFISYTIFYLLILALTRNTIKSSFGELKQIVRNQK